MIKRLDNPTKPQKARRGFQHVSEVIERLIRMYELKAEMNAERERAHRPAPVAAAVAEPVGRELVVSSAVQSTFGWD